MPIHSRGRADAPRSSRDPWLDNAKLILVTLVVIGHSWTMLPSSTLGDHVYSFLYAWHMPAFVMISGYLSRSMTWTRAKVLSAVRTLLVPYAVLECLLGLFRTYVGHESLDIELLHPSWPMWFLVALFLWRMAAPALLRMPRPAAIGLAVAASVLIGWSTWEIVDVARVCGFAPFFVVGLVARPAHLELLRSRFAPAIGLIGMVGVWWATGPIDQWARSDWLFYNLTYADFGTQGWEAVPTRLAVIALGLGGALAFLTLVPRRRGVITAMGAQSMVVYLFHGFFVKEARYLGLPDWLGGHPVLGWFALTVGFGAVGLLLASAPVARVLGWFADPFGRAKRELDRSVDLAVAAAQPVTYLAGTPDEVRIGAGEMATSR
ncbi:acyltransferase family protein [Nocardioides montaniterrae]